MDDPSIEIVAGIGGGILLGALFSVVDAGLTSLGRVRLVALKEAGGAYANVAARALTHSVAVNARLRAGRALSLGICLALTVWSLRHRGIIVALLAAGVVTFLFAAASEVGRSVAAARPSRSTLRALLWLRPLELLLAPLAAPLVWVAARTAEAVPPKSEDENSERVVELAVEHMIEEGEETGSIAEDQAQLLRSVLEFKNTVIREVMVPRTQVVAFEHNTEIDDAIAQILDSAHSRYPVFRDHIDQVEGVVYAKDLFVAVFEKGQQNTTLQQLMRQPVFLTSEHEKIGAVLREMQSRRSHLAVVVDEFGGTSGIVTLEDILEEIVGEIEDEHDEESERVRSVGPSRYIVDADISVYDLEETLGSPLSLSGGDYESLGGMLIDKSGAVPHVGDVIHSGDFDLIVVDADDRHVRKVEIVRRVTPSKTHPVADAI